MLKSLIQDKRTRVLLGAAVVGVIILSYYAITSGTEKTDNATVQCEWSDVAPELAGVIKEIRVADTEFVNKGDVVMSLEDDFVRADLAKLDAEVAAAQMEFMAAEERSKLEYIDIEGNLVISNSSAEEAQSQLTSFEKEITATSYQHQLAKIDSERLKSEFDRFKKLYEKKYISIQDYEDSENLYSSSVLKVDELSARLESLSHKLRSEKEKHLQAKSERGMMAKSEAWMKSSSQIDVEIANRKMEVVKALRNISQIRLDRMKVKARISGRFTNRRASVGQHLLAGQPLGSIVSCKENVWVQANYKETQIENMKPGQKVKIKIDAYPDQVFRGVVTGISDGSGATFSVLPPENATGNFTKVVQRFPTRIDIVEDQGLELRVGMSVVATVYTD